MDKFSEDLIAPCGINCSTCIVFFGYTMNGNVRKKKCNGCRIENKKCAFLKKGCSKLAKGEVDFCFECDDFPCENLNKLDADYRKRYNMSLIDNLLSIKEKGIDSFLLSEESRWKCPECGEKMCCHKDACLYCGFKRTKFNVKGFK